MTILVTGATGNIGRKVVDKLLAAGAADIRALTKHPERAALPPEVEVVAGYLGRPETLSAVFDDVEKTYLAPTPDTVDEVVTLAHRAGVRHVVDLSGEPESWWSTVANAVEDSGMEWTHLWPWDFMENARIWADQIRDTGTVREPYPHAASVPIAMDDIAAVAAAALLHDGHAGAAYTLTGPETLSRTEMVRKIGEALDREIDFVTVSRDTAVDALTSTMGGNAAWYVDNVLTLLAESSAEGTTAVERITGRPATTFAQWAAEHPHMFTN